jgi:hypothetical protein
MERRLRQVLNGLASLGDCCLEQFGFDWSPAVHHKLIRYGGLVTVVIGLVQFSVGVSVFSSISGPKLGAWWSAILPIVAGCLATKSTYRCVFSSVVHELPFD